MLKKVLLVLGALAVVAVLGCVIVGWWVYGKMTGPMYEPGDVAGASIREPPPQAGDRDQWTVESGIRLHRYARGSGRPILYVHGGPGFPTREPMAWLEALYTSNSVHFYDQRGCGGSTRPFDRFTSQNYFANMTQLESTLGLGAQVADIERIRRILGEEKLLLVGHSFGGFLATLYAAEFPERVEKLVLLAPADMLVMPSETGDLLSLVGDRLPADERDAYDRFLEGYLDFGSIFARDDDELARMNLTLGNHILRAMGRPVLPTPAEGAPVDAGGWMVHAMYFSMGRRHDYRDALSSITADTLIVHGDADLQPIAVSEEYLSLIANAALVTVPGADHFFEGEQRGLATTVREFLGVTED